MAYVRISWLTPELARISVSPRNSEFGRGTYDPLDSIERSLKTIGENHKILQITPVTGVNLDDHEIYASITVTFLILVEPRPKEKPIGIPPFP